MNDVNKQAVLSAIRTLLAAAGVWMATHKYIDVDSANEIVGALMVLIPLAWGAWDKFRSEQATKEREVVAVNAGITVADKTKGKTPKATPKTAEAIIEKFSPAVKLKGLP